MGLEPATSSLPRKCSTPELQQQESGRRDSNPRPSAWKANALSTELLPQKPPPDLLQRRRSEPWQIFPSHYRSLSFPSLWEGWGGLWAVKDSNLRSRKTAELQSAPVGHFGNCPIYSFTHRIGYNQSSLNPLYAKLSLLSDSNQRPRDYKSRALAN